ncbi:uncharacterized protein LOC122790751 [Protopterus annectens]|uniref:uncharacterized protein LOC122790751 n=1 Tax=Protopterus annectens TaxID=7888 RepID=UPI001CF9D6AE|nr:uncharacterized protein LOC122790751 [Protopterus annectens]
MAMKPEQGLLTVKVEQKYLLGVDTKTKLQQLGAICVDKIIEKDHYYDTDTYALALNQIWLRQRNAQWYLIVCDMRSTKKGTQESLRDNKHVSKEDCAIPVEELGFSGRKSGLNHGFVDAKHQHEYISRISTKKMGVSQNSTSDESSELQPDKSRQTKQLKTKGNSNKEGPNVQYHSGYKELCTVEEIISYLAEFLHIALTADEEATMTMEAFMQLAGIRHYASWHAIKRITYKLQGIYTIITEMDELAAKEMATISMDASITHIGRDFDQMGKLAAELGFESYTIG